MAETVSKLLANMVKYQNNPALIQRDVYDHLTVVTGGGVEIVDPTNPFVFATEAAVVLAAGAMAQAEALTRQQYPLVAQTRADLYRHMTDKDYIGRFAVPSRASFGLAFAKDELLNKLVLDPDTKMKKMVIPRNTEFTVSDYTFSLQYPIEIRQLSHGGIQVVYDADVVSPLQTLETNVINFEYRDNAGVTWLFFTVPAYQFKIQTLTNNISPAEAFELTIPITDQFYYARAYSQNADGSWTEIKTTHSDQIYDPIDPTAVLRVEDGSLKVTIPQIYTSAQLLNSKLRVDMYETKGLLEIDLGSYPTQAFQATWLAIDKADETIFTAPLKTIKTFMMFSESRTSGGADEMSFEALRLQVIKNNVGGQVTPITNVQIESMLQRQGYDLVKNIDHITNRVMLATRPMPTPSNEKLITAAAASIETLSITAKEAVLQPTVIDNGTSITLTPNTLYQNVKGVMKLALYETVVELLQLPPDTRALVVSGGNYYYTPFHYVLDMSDNQFSARAYYLDDPKAVTKVFKSENDTTLLQVTTDTYAVQRTASGYKLRIVTKSGDTFKALADDQVFVQLAFTPPNEKDKAYLNGVLVGRTEDTNERVYDFDLSTNFDVDSNDALQLTQFMMYSVSERLTGAPLTCDFQVLYSTTLPMDVQWEAADVDKQLGRFLLPTGIVGITHEAIRIEFGQSLKSLWTRARSVISEVTYKTWPTDVPLTYEKDIYEVFDAGTGSTVKIENGEVVMNKLHTKGDPVLDGSGNPVYKYRKGDVMRDGSGNPIPSEERDMLRQVDIMLVEGVYWFATDATAIAYRTELVNAVVSWVVENIGELNKEVLEKTKIYFYPKTTQGLVEVMFGDGLITTISAGQAMKLDLYVNKDVDQNDDLKRQLIRTSITVISTMLGQSTVSISAILSALRTRYGEDVIDVGLSGLGGAANLPLITVTDDARRCSLRKRLVAQADETLIVEEDLTVNFIRHERRA